MANGIGNITKLPELRKRVVFTILMLGVFRLGVFIPTPGINTDKVRDILKGEIFNNLNLFSGGALEGFSIFALGIMPYISASIIFQLLAVVVPSLEKLQNEEGELGRKKINQWTRYATILLSLIQGLGIAYGLQSQSALNPGVGGISYYAMTVLTLTAGTCFIMWLGEQITERGIGNGISLIIFAGIVTRIPKGFVDAWGQKHEYGEIFGFVILLAAIVALIAFIIFMERAQRRIPINYAKRVVGRKMYSGQSSYLPLKVNTAGVIPPIFASSLLSFPAAVLQFMPNSPIRSFLENFFPGGGLYYTIYVVLIIFFCFFYTAVTFDPIKVAENVKKHGGFIPGIRPGKSTADYIDKVLTRLTLGGSLYVAAICVVPLFLAEFFRVPNVIAYTFGGTSVLIVVGVAMDTVSQIEQHLLTRNYEGFLGAKGGKFKGRRA